MTYDAIILGGGAAGLFCAIEAGKRGRKTLLIEHNAEVGRKIIISGGGRCNFTNIHTSPDNFISRNPHFCKSALARYTPEDFIRLVQKHRIEFYEKKFGSIVLPRQLSTDRRNAVGRMCACGRRNKNAVCGCKGRQGRAF